MLTIASVSSRYICLALYVTFSISCSSLVGRAATITGWDFQTGSAGSMQGWTNVSTSTTGPLSYTTVAGTPGSGAANWDPVGYNSKVPEFGFMLGPVGWAGRDVAQSAPLVVRSPTFQLHDGQIIAHLLGGTPGAVAVAPVSFGALTLSGPSLSTTGSPDASYIGIALRRASDGAYLAHGARTNNNIGGTGWQQVTFSDAVLAPIIAANPGAMFTLDLIDTAHATGGGTFGSIALDTVSVPAAEGGSLVAGGGQWNILERRSPTAVASLAAADTLLGLSTGDPAITAEYSGSAAVINFHGTGNSGHFGDDSPYLGGAGSVERLAMRITGKIEVTQAGDITFGFFANDGGRLRINDNLIAQDDFADLATDTLGTINLPAGLHDLEFVYFENNSGDTVELFVATTLGAHTSLADSSWELLQPSAIPEPSTLLLAATTVLGLVVRRRVTTRIR